MRFGRRNRTSGSFDRACETGHPRAARFNAQPAAIKPSFDLVGDVELGVQFIAECSCPANDRKCDQGGNQAVSNGSRARFILNKRTRSWAIIGLNQLSPRVDGVSGIGRKRREAIT